MHKVVQRLASLAMVVMASLVTVPLASQAQEQQIVTYDYEGVIRELDFSGSSMIVSGWDFDVPADAPVTIRGTHGAFTMLKVGMKVNVSYMERGGQRITVSVDQLPDNHEVMEF